VSVSAALALLLLGRWLALRTANALWSSSVGVGESHRAIADLQLVLALIAFLAATIWCVGNLYLVYRSIGSVQVPRRLGNIEIVETVPRRYLLIGAVGVGLILAYAMSRGAGDWWSIRALYDAAAPIGVRDPVLNRDIAYYLFRLPWYRTLHGYVLLLTGLMLAITLFLYVAVGAIRWSDRRLDVADLARTHVGALLVAFALALFWGYRIEPAELVAGYHNVPYDTVLLSIRLPVARLLSGLALVVGGASAIWIWLGHPALVAVAWIALAGTSFVGHYLAPAISAGGRTPEERADPTLARAAVESVGEAFGLQADTAVAPLAIPDAGFAARHARALTHAPLWDPFAVTVMLNRTSQPRAFDRFFDATMGAHGAPGAVEPVYIAVREVDLQTAGENDRGMTWDRRHRDPYARAAGAVAVHGSRVSDDGLPLYVPDLGRPDSTSPFPVDIALTAPDVWFAPTTTELAVASTEDGPFAGVRLDGLLRRLALAWTLQAPKLLSASTVGPGMIVLSDRAVGDRLARVAPFARFGAAYPVIANGVLSWVAPGYVWSEAYPLSVVSRWRGRQVRSLHMGFIGVVDARSGATGVYLAPDADPISATWATLAPEIVRPADALPESVRAGLRYPVELFQVQLELLRRTDWRPGQAGGAARTPEPYWWVGESFADSVSRLRLRAVIEVQLDARVAAIVDGTVAEGTPRLSVVAYPEPRTLPGPSELVHEFAEDASGDAAIPGVLKLAPFPDGAIAVQAFYAEPRGPAAPPRLAEVAVGWRGAIGRGPDLATAVRRIRVARPPPEPAADRWTDARRWFDRLDAARVSGDWLAFGEAYAALKRLLTLPPDSR